MVILEELCRIGTHIPESTSNGVKLVLESYFNFATDDDAVYQLVQHANCPELLRSLFETILPSTPINETCFSRSNLAMFLDLNNNLLFITLSTFGIMANNDSEVTITYKLTQHTAANISSLTW